MSEGRAPEARDGRPPILDAAARAALLAWARANLEGALGRRLPDPPHDSALLGPGGAFVSLHTREGELRGCVGLLESDDPLRETVARMVLAAARDGRFTRVRAPELGALVIEISVLGPLTRIRPEEVEVGKHGLLLRHQGVSGVLLPQVATDHGWSPEEFLAKTAWKAGLPEDAWKAEGAEILAFTALVFAEEIEEDVASRRGGWREAP